MMTVTQVAELDKYYTAAVDRVRRCSNQAIGFGLCFIGLCLVKAAELLAARPTR